MLFLKNSHRRKTTTDTTELQFTRTENETKSTAEKSHVVKEEKISEQSICANKDFDLNPKYVSERYYYDNEGYMKDHNLEIEFSKSVIRSLFGFDDDLYKKCLLFSALPNPRLASAFGHLWRAVFLMHKENALIKSSYDEVEYHSVFNYQTGKMLLEKSKQLILQEKIQDNIAEIVFKSCITTQGLVGFEGYADFDFITALSILLLKEQYPNIQIVKANVYFGSGIYLDNLNFPVKIESTVNQRFIYGLINSR